MTEPREITVGACKSGEIASGQTPLLGSGNVKMLWPRSICCCTSSINGGIITSRSWSRSLTLTGHWQEMIAHGCRIFIEQWRMHCRHQHTRRGLHPHWPNSGTQQTRDIHPRLVQCWTSVVDGGPTLNQSWVNVSCLLGGTGPPLETLTLTSSPVYESDRGGVAVRCACTARADHPQALVIALLWHICRHSITVHLGCGLKWVIRQCHEEGDRAKARISFAKPDRTIGI